MAVKNEKTPSLQQIGKKLEAGVSQKEALLKLLKNAASQLQSIEQSAAENITTDIKSCAKALMKPQYFRHRDKDVRLLVAFCCSEATRIFAPDPPYSDSELTDIFSLFVACFNRLDDISSPSFNRVVAILESLARVKTCIVMLDLELDSLIQEMFQLFFSVISPEHPSNVQMAMVDVMSLIFAESEEVSQDLLNIVLENLGLGEKGKSQAAYDLAFKTVQQSAAHLQGPVVRHIISMMRSSDKAKVDYHELIFEVYKAAPEILVAILPSMMDELRKDDLTVRSKAVKLLGRIFALPHQTAHSDYKHLYHDFLKRFSDTVGEVRLQMVEWAESYLSQEHCLDAREVVDNLAQRILDPNDKTRAEAVRVICSIATSQIGVIPSEVLRQAAERLRDKKVSLRKLTLQQLSRVYRQYCAWHQEGREVNPIDYEWIPGKLISVCLDKEVKEFKVQGFDVFLDDLFPSKLTVENLSAHWVRISSNLDGKQSKILAAIFQLKSHIQTQFGKYLEFRQKLKEDKSNAEVEKTLKDTLKNVSVAFIDSEKALEHLQKVNSLKDNNIFKAISSLLNPNLSLEGSRSIREEILRRLGEKHPLHEFMTILVSKLSPSLYCADHIRCSLKFITEKETSDREFCEATVQLLVEVSAHFPALFEQFQAHLMKMLTDGSAMAKDGAANILSKVGGKIKDVLPAPSDTTLSVSATLEDLALNGSRNQAKHAISAIVSLSKDDGFAELSSLYEKLVESLQIENLERLPTVFQSLGTIAQLAMSVFEKQEDDIVKFVVRTILRLPSDHFDKNNPGKKKSFVWEDLSDTCQLKIQGLKVLVKSFLPLKDGPMRPKLRGLLNVLEKLIPMGELNEDLARQSTEVDRAQLRLASCKALLRLARKYEPYIQQQSPKLFQLAVLTVQDPCLQVRQLLALKIHKLLHSRESPLPSKYAAAFVLDFIDAEKSNVALSKRYFSEFVESCRREAVLRQSKLLSSSSEVSTLTFHPEYVLVYLVHIIAHHPNFPLDSQNAADYEPFKSELHGCVRALMHVDSDSKSDAAKQDMADVLPPILAIFRTIKNVSEDAVDPSKTQALHSVCDIGIMVAKELGRKKLYPGEYPGRVPLPMALFKTAQGEAASMSELRDGSNLPKCLVEDESKPKTKPKLKSSQTSSLVLGLKPKRKKRRSKKSDSDEESDDSESEHSDSHGYSSEGVATKVEDPGSHEPSSKKQKSEDNPEPKKTRILPTRGSGKSSATAMPKEEPKSEKPDPQKKEITSAKKPAAADSPALPKFGAEVIGKRIKVWWPMDKAFYVGTISKFDNKAKHFVVYDDGDEEFVNLSKEKWEFVEEEKGSNELKTNKQKKSKKQPQTQRPTKRQTTSKASVSKIEGSKKEITKKSDGMVQSKLKSVMPAQAVEQKPGSFEFEEQDTTVQATMESNSEDKRLTRRAKMAALRAGRTGEADGKPSETKLAGNEEEIVMELEENEEKSERNAEEREEMDDEIRAQVGDPAAEMAGGESGKIAATGSDMDVVQQETGEEAEIKEGNGSDDDDDEPTETVRSRRRKLN